RRDPARRHARRHPGRPPALGAPRGGRHAAHRGFRTDPLRTLLERCDRASWATWERVALYRLARHLRDTATAARLAPSDEAALDSWTPGVRTLFPVEVGFGPGYRVVALGRNANNN